MSPTRERTGQLLLVPLKIQKLRGEKIPIKFQPLLTTIKEVIKSCMSGDEGLGERRG